MVLPLILPPLPLHPKHDVLHVNEILTKGYHVARCILDLVQLDLHQIHYHKKHIWSEFVPLLDIILESTSDMATHSWCHAVTMTFAHLFHQLTECEALAKHRFTFS